MQRAILLLFTILAAHMFADETGQASSLLEQADSKALADWIQEKPEDRAVRFSSLLSALRSRLDTQMLPTDPDSAAQAFPTDRYSPAERWEIARTFASSADLAAASRMAHDALPGLPPETRAEAALRLAEWRLYLGERQRALAALGNARHYGAPGFHRPAMLALRSQWLLATEPEQEKFAAAAAGLPLAKSAHALLLAMKGNTEALPAAAPAVLEEWLAACPDGVSFTDSILTPGILQALGWNLPELARGLLNAARQLDPAAMRLRGIASGNWQADLNWLQSLIAIASCSPQELEFRLAELPRTESPQPMINLARQLDLLDRPGAANAVREMIWRQFPTDPLAAPEGIAAANTRGDSPLAAVRIHEWLQSGKFPPNYALRSDYTRELAGILLSQGRPAEALAAVEPTLELAPADSQLIAVKDEALAELSKTEDRIALRKEQAELNPAEKNLPLARFLVRHGREEEALAVEPLPADGKTRIQLEAAIARNQITDAENALETLKTGQAWAQLCEVAGLGVQSPIREGVLSTLRDGATNAENSADRFRCAMTLARLADSQKALVEALTLARESADAENDRKGTFLRQRFLLGRQIAPDWLRTVLEREWRHGNGDSIVGAQLLQLAIEQKAELSTLLDSYLTPRHYDRNAWASLARSLAEAEHHAEAARVYELLATRQTGELQFVKDHAVELWKSGDHEAALSALRPIRLSAKLSPQQGLQLADFFWETGQRKKAMAHYARIAATERTSAQTTAWWQLARLARENDDLAGAKLWLTAALQDPTDINLSEVAAWLLAQPDFSERSPDQMPFELPEPVWSRVRLEIAERLVASGQSEAALDWLPATLLHEDRAQAVLHRIADNSDLREKVDAKWQAAPPSRSRNRGYAQFLAQHNSGSIPSLKKARELDPANFEIARLLAQALHDAGEEAEATRILEEAILEGISIPDRARARKLIETWSASRDLPPAPDAS